MSEVVKTASPAKVSNPAEEEKVRLLTKLLKGRNYAVLDYKSTIKHTGGLLTVSMGYAYAKGFEKAIQILTNEDKDVTKS